VPIGFGMLVGNIPLTPAACTLGIYETEQRPVISSTAGVTQGWYPSLIFLGIGAMTDFSADALSPAIDLARRCGAGGHLL
jgi:Na+-transporting methylmalonyl-CoA/oxaloacetate decarboxylase beta subunit